MSRRFLLLTMLVMVLSPRSAQAQDPVYPAQLRQALDAIETARAASGPDRTQAVTRALDRLRGIKSAPGSATPYLLHVEEALTRRPPDLLLARDYLVDLLAELEGTSVQAETTTQDEALRRAYADSRFERDEAPNWLERALNGVGDWLRRLLQGLPSGSPGAEGLTAARWLLVLLCIGLAGLVLALVLRSARRITRTDVAASAGIASASSTALLAVAAERASTGDYRGAVRAQFVALLLTLHEQDILRYDRSLTNREHLSRIGRNSSLAGALRPVVRVFDDVWYGNVPIGQTEYDDYARSTDALRGGAR